MDEVDRRQEDAIKGLESREVLILWCCIIGAIGSLFQIFEALTIFNRMPR